MSGYPGRTALSAIRPRDGDGLRVAVPLCAWQSREVTDLVSSRDWLTVPDLVELLGTTPGRVRRLIEDRHLAGLRLDGVLKVPADFLRDGQPLSELRGTLILLADVGFDNDGAIRWLLSTEESLGAAPIDALRSGRKAEVRRIAQALA